MSYGKRIWLNDGHRMREDHKLDDFWYLYRCSCLQITAHQLQSKESYLPGGEWLIHPLLSVHFHPSCRSWTNWTRQLRRQLSVFLKKPQALKLTLHTHTLLHSQWWKVSSRYYSFHFKIQNFGAQKKLSSCWQPLESEGQTLIGSAYSIAFSWLVLCKRGTPLKKTRDDFSLYGEGQLLGLGI